MTDLDDFEEWVRKSQNNCEEADEESVGNFTLLICLALIEKFRKVKAEG